MNYKIEGAIKKNTKTIIPGSVSRKVDNAFSNEITERSCNTRI